MKQLSWMKSKFKPITTLKGEKIHVVFVFSVADLLCDSISDMICKLIDKRSDEERERN